MLCQAPSPSEEKQALENKMGIKYRHVMGEVYTLWYAILLSQYMNDPGEEHYMALKSLVTYLAATSLQGIHYWRSIPNNPLTPYHTRNRHQYTTITMS
jgi:hypothetical protein